MKKIVSYLILFVLLISLSSCNSIPDPVIPVDGISFNTDEIYNKYGDDVYSCSSKLTDIPHTFECWIRVPEDQSGTNVIFGNYDSHIVSYINFSINSGKPRIYWRDSRKQDYNVNFNQVDVRTNDFLHLTVVHNYEIGEFYCYVNGELKQTQKYYPDFEPSVIDGYFAVGGDSRKLNQCYFKGEIAELNLFSDVRTENEIRRDMAAPALDDENLLVSYDLAAQYSGQSIPDRSKNNLDLQYTNLWLTEEEVSALRNPEFERAYSFAVIGDTQYMTEFAPSALDTMYGWIVANKDKHNIVYSIGVGDITNRDSQTEWDRFKSAISVMDGVVPYSLVRGNHDLKNYSKSANTKYDPDGTGSEASTMGFAFDNMFATDKAYTDQFTVNGGFYEEGSVMNTYRLLETDNSKWLLLNLDYCPSDAVLAWAGNICEKYPEHKAVIVTHGYNTSNNNHIVSGDPKEKSYKGIKLPAGELTSNDGGGIWEKLVSVYPNITMVLCGHISTNQVLTSQVTGKNGNTITEILIDAQDYDLNLKGLGLVAMFYFNADGTAFEVEYYSTVLDRYYRSTNCFTVDLTAKGEDYKIPLWNGYSEQPDGDGSEQNPYLIENAGNLLWISEEIKETEGAASFEGKFFKQTADIDLDGKTINPIGNYYYSSDFGMYAFGGTYDGSGYTIKNGFISYIDSEKVTFNREFGFGLFGVIYGATIRNVTLDDITVVGNGVTGAIVGKAAGSSVGDSDATFNLIENCKVMDSCKIVNYLPASSVPTSIEFESNFHAGVTGSIAGMARSSTIINCISDISVNLGGYFDSFGGIAGCAGYNTLIENCKYTGDAKYTDDTNEEHLTYLGGLVAIASPSEVTFDTGDACEGSLTIKNCKNKSNLKPDIAYKGNVQVID